MTGKSDDTGRTATPSQAGRRQRLAETLRANLRRRKAQAQARLADPGPADQPDPAEDPALRPDPATGPPPQPD